MCMMEVVEFGAPTSRSVIAIMSRQGGNENIKVVEQEMHRVLGDEHGRHKYTREVDNMLNWVHAHATPWAGVVRSVVQAVNMTVEPTAKVNACKLTVFRKVRMHDSMCEVEMEVAPIDHEQHPTYAPEWVLPKARVKRSTARSPEVQHNTLIE